MKALGILLAALAGYLVYNGHIYTTGAIYYETCWERIAKTEGFSEPKATSATQAAKWANCEPIARRAVFSSGMIFAGRETGEDYDRLRKSCPDSYNEVPLGGVFIIFIKEIQGQGGPTFSDRVIPAEYTLSTIAKRRWPNCNAERERQGFPPIVETAAGQFQWARPCPKCK